MEKDSSIKKTTFNVGCLSWPGIVLSVAIIAIRAFQPNATPMVDWSWWSWCLMLLPAFFSFAIWAALAILAVFCTAFSINRW